MGNATPLTDSVANTAFVVTDTSYRLKAPASHPITLPEVALFENFLPDLVTHPGIVPLAAKVTNPESPWEQQRWIVTVGVAHESVAVVGSNHDFFCDQLRNGSPSFWPQSLALEIVPTPRIEISNREVDLKKLWDHRQLEQGLVLPPVPRSPAVPRENSLEGALRMLEGSFSEGAGALVVGPQAATPSRSEQIIDLRVEDRAPSRRALQHILRVAILKGASDIHLEYNTDGIEPPHVAVRLRVDGVLQPLIHTFSSLGPQILNILGTAAGAGVEESSFHMRPQDGKIIIHTPEGRRLDGRLAFVPVPVTSNSFNCTIRLLDSSQKFDLHKLDLSKRNLEILKEGMELDHGMIVLTGPTGSGKSSTIQACLRHIISPQLKVITIEDPVEYFLAGAEQTQVSHKDTSMSFANLLRSAMRRDPDVIFMGEIRDQETAEVAIKAALTGHLIFTTIHANSALAVVDRLIDLGIHPDLVASALAVVGAQRLIRRIVPDRWDTTQRTLGEIQDHYKLRLSSSEAAKTQTISIPQLRSDFQSGDFDNYRGRLAVHEFQNFDIPLKDAIRSGARGTELWRMARERGMRTLFEDGLQKARQGVTSFEELVTNLRGT